MKDNDFFTEIKGKYIDECVSKGICSQSPTLSYLHEVLILQLKELSFYLLKLKEFGISNEEIKEDFINTISSLIVGVHFGEEQFLKITQNLNSYLKQAKDLYLSLCEKNNMKCEFLRSFIKFPKQMKYSDAINLGQKIINKKEEKITSEQKILFEVVANVMKSICIHIIELRELGIQSEDFYEKLLEAFNSLNFYEISTEDLKKLIDEFAEFDYTLLIKLHETRQELYGIIAPSEISMSTRINKAILVSGTNLYELENLLEITKDKDIDIYTHGHMLMAHGFPKFRAYKNLVGHFGKGIETYLLDFAEFPGPVFLTRHSEHKVENLFRSRIFTTDVIAPKGVTVLKNKDFSPLVESALTSRGFTKSVSKPSIKINLDEKNLFEKINDAAKKFEKGDYKHFFVIGVSNHTKTQNDYFDRFLELIDDDCFVLSFSYSNSKKNVLKVESECAFPLIYSALEILTNNVSLDVLKPFLLMTRCEAHTLSNMVYLKHMGVNNIYFADCPPAMVNPALIKGMRELYGLKSYSNPDSDYKAMILQK